MKNKAGWPAFLYNIDMNIYIALKNQKFSVNEKAMIDLILEDPSSFIKMDISEITEKAHVSRSTIYRLCEKTGTSGLSEFKLRLSEERENFEKEENNFDFNYPMHGGENGHKIASILKEDYAETVQVTENLLDFRSLHLAAKWIHDAEMTDIYASAGNIFFADNFRFQMCEIGKYVNVPHESYEWSLCAATSNVKHVAIVISFGGRSIGVENICKTLKANKTKIILIGSKEAKTLEKYADVKLYMAQVEDHYRKISSFSTRVSLLYLLDILYSAIFALDYEENKKNKSFYYERMTGKR